MPTTSSPRDPLSTTPHTCVIIEPSSPAPRRPLWQTWVRVIGLPCLISVAAIDPGNLEVDLQAGQLVQYHLIWSLLISSIIGFILQTLSAHLTIHTGRHLAELCSVSYRPYPLLSNSIFVFAELSIVAFDVAEVVGTAFALHILFGWPLWLGMLLSAVDTMLVLYLQKHGLSKIEIIIEGMLIILAFCLFYEFLLTSQRFGAMLEGLVVPSFGRAPREGAILAIGILGSVIMSHNLYLHSWLVKERLMDTPPSDRHTIQSACRYATWESAAIFFATFLINGCVMSVTAALPESAFTKEIGLKDAGALLQNVLGTEWANTAWGVALLASGHAATVTGTLASQAVCEGFLNIREGVSPQGMVLMTRAVAIVPAVAAAVVAGESGADKLIVGSQVVLSFALPFAVVPVFKVMLALGQNGWLMKGGFVSIGLLFVANLVAVLASLKEVADKGVIALQIVLGSSVLIIVLVWRLVFTPVEVEGAGETEKLSRARNDSYGT